MDSDNPEGGLRPPADLALAAPVIGRWLSLILGDGLEADLLDTSIPEATSGMLVSLVASAGVVVVLGCWSAAGHAYDNDDRRILEILAGHVAPAIGTANRFRATEEQADTDPLTGLPNRRQLADDILRDYAPAPQTGRPLFVAMLDIDHFKWFNDHHGPSVGGAALRIVTTTMQASLRSSDNVYRFGGEEFLIVLKSTSIQQATDVIERLRANVKSVTHSSTEIPGGITVSVGLVVGPDHGDEFPLLVDSADQALYVAKNEGRDRLAVWSPVDRGALAA
ncbi:MAG: sensor domain-containing diguanylate cyclase [Dehalococcoidia bacterium]|nr:sensor domain-containing diguanylate cyclase [Dehalococcoidia bacterium]